MGKKLTEIDYNRLSVYLEDIEDMGDISDEKLDELIRKFCAKLKQIESCDGNHDRDCYNCLTGH